MREIKIKLIRKKRRMARSRNKLNSDRPRLTVFRSNKYIYAQIIDKSGKTLVAASEKDVDSAKMTKTHVAELVGKSIAAKAGKKKIKEIVFDKGSYRYHGRVKALADGAREGGLAF